MGVSQDYNPFANQQVHVPKAYHEYLNRYSGTFNPAGENTASKEAEVPFKRYIDFWLVAAAVGAANDHFVPLDSSDRRDFITGQVLQRDLPAIEFLLLLAIAHTGDAYVVNDPRQVLDIAEGYAAGGIPVVKEMMEDGHLTPLMNLARSMSRLST